MISAAHLALTRCTISRNSASAKPLTVQVFPAMATIATTALAAKTTASKASAAFSVHHPLPLPSVRSPRPETASASPGCTAPCSQLRFGPTRGRKHMQTEQLFTLAFAAMVVVLVLGFASMYH
jgi:hypothetical protein